MASGSFRAAFSLATCSRRARSRAGVASRAPRGRVGTTYGYAGGGRQLANLGAIFTGARRPQQARIDLMLALGAGLTGDALRAVFDS